MYWVNNYKLYSVWYTVQMLPQQPVVNVVERLKSKIRKSMLNFKAKMWHNQVENLLQSHIYDRRLDSTKGLLLLMHKSDLWNLQLYLLSLPL